MTVEQQLHDLVLRFHRAHADHDADALRACHAESYFRWLGGGSDDPADWIPAAFCTAEYMQEWGKDPHVNSSTYEFDVKFLSTKANDELGIVVTEDSGSWTDADGKTMAAWSNTRNIYFAALREAEWRLVGMIAHPQTASACHCHGGGMIIPP